MASQAAIAHPIVINLDNSLVLPFLSFECLGVAELLPAPTRPILPPTVETTGTPARRELSRIKDYVYIVQMSEIPKAFGGEENEWPRDWFCNEETNCDTMSHGSDRLKDIKIWNWGQAPATDTQAGQGHPKQLEGTAAPQEPEQPAAKDQTHVGTGTGGTGGRPRTTEPATPRSIALRIKGTNAVPSLPVHKSLLHALSFALFGSRFDSKTTISGLFQLLEGIASGYTRYLIHRIDMKKLFETGRPISHVFLDVIASVTFMKDLAKMDKKETELPKFWAERQTFWKGKFGSSDICYLCYILMFY